MKYSRKIKKSTLRKILPPENRSVADVAREMGISDQTIYNWKHPAENGTLFLDDTKRPPLWSLGLRHIFTSAIATVKTSHTPGTLNAILH